jgi:hypothetical protein
VTQARCPQAAVDRGDRAIRVISKSWAKTLYCAKVKPYELWEIDIRLFNASLVFSGLASIM